MLQSSKRKDLFLLIEAVEYVENQDKQITAQEHGYAAPYQCGTEPLTTKMKVSRRGHNRTSHNELEKNRRAHLRRCLDDLKAIVPLQNDATKHTTLGLLKDARALINTLMEEEQKLMGEKSLQCKRNAFLKRSLMQLEKSRNRRNSTGSGWSSGHSESSNDSDKDDEIIDVTDCSDVADLLQSRAPMRNGKLITISVTKPLSLQSRSLVAGMKRAVAKVVS